MADVRRQIEQKVHIPEGYQIIYGGQFENLQRASKQLGVVIPLTLIIIFLILFAFYRNIREAAIAMSCVLLALPGGIVALLVRGYHFNISAGVGFVSLFGICVMTGILFVSSINLKLRQNIPLLEAIRDSAIEQFRLRVMVILLAMIAMA